MSDINTPDGDAASSDPDEKTPPEDMSSYNIELPPEGAETPGAPDAGNAPDDDDTDHDDTDHAAAASGDE